MAASLDAASAPELEQCAAVTAAGPADSHADGLRLLGAVLLLPCSSTREVAVEVLECPVHLHTLVKVSSCMEGSSPGPNTADVNLHLQR